MNTGGGVRFYVTRPNVDAMNSIANHITSDKSSREYYIIFVPRMLALCEDILEQQGVYGLVTVMEWKLYLIPLDQHILSLEIQDCVPTLYLTGDCTLLRLVANSIAQLESVYGYIETFHGKGHLAKQVWQLFERIRKRGIVKKSVISSVIFFDRRCDLVSPVCSQLTYEGILDDVFNTRNGYVELTGNVTGKKQNVKVQLNSKDPVFKVIRSQHFSSVPSLLSEISNELKGRYSKGRNEESLKELSKFVKELPKLKEKHESLSTHLKASEHIIIKKKDAEFQRQLACEQAILDVYDKAKKEVVEFIEECIQREFHFTIPLQLMCLLSASSDGIKPSQYKLLKQNFMMSYGSKHIVTFHHLDKVGLLREYKEEPKVTFKQLSKIFKLVPRETIPDPKEMSYVHGGLYKPLSCAAVEHVIQHGDWVGPEVSLKDWSATGSGGGPTFSYGASQRKRTSASPTPLRGQVILVYFIGGCTFSEINALQILGTQLDCSFIVATTNIINANTFISSLAA